MAARDRMLEKNPELIFVGCHLSSLEWSVEELALFLDRFPNASVDMAARMGQLFYQTHENREKVRDFFIEYQDRITVFDVLIISAFKEDTFSKYFSNSQISNNRSDCVC